MVLLHSSFDKITLLWDHTALHSTQSPAQSHPNPDLVLNGGPDPRVDRYKMGVKRGPYEWPKTNEWVYWGYKWSYISISYNWFWGGVCVQNLFAEARLQGRQSI